ETGDCRGTGGQRAVDLQPRWYGYGHRSAVRIDEWPVGARAAVGVNEARQLRQFLRVARAAVFLDQRGRGADLHADGRQLAGDQRGVLQPRDADGKVEAFLDQVHEPVVEADFQRDLRVLDGKLDHRLADRRIGKGA